MRGGLLGSTIGGAEMDGAQRSLCWRAPLPDTDSCSLINILVLRVYPTPNNFVLPYGIFPLWLHGPPPKAPAASTPTYPVNSRGTYLPNYFSVGAHPLLRAISPLSLSCGTRDGDGALRQACSCPLATPESSWRQKDQKRSFVPISWRAQRAREPEKRFTIINAPPPPVRMRTPINAQNYPLFPAFTYARKRKFLLFGGLACGVTPGAQHARRRAYIRACVRSSGRWAPRARAHAPCLRPKAVEPRCVGLWHAARVLASWRCTAAVRAWTIGCSCQLVREPGERERALGVGPASRTLWLRRDVTHWT